MCQVFQLHNYFDLWFRGRICSAVSSVEDSQAYNVLHFSYLQSVATYLSLNRKSTIQKSYPLPTTQKKSLNEIIRNTLSNVNCVQNVNVC